MAENNTKPGTPENEKTLDIRLGEILLSDWERSFAMSVLCPPRNFKN
jgi:hypothetical protein